MIVEDLNKLSEDIQVYFNANYTPSKTINVPGRYGGWETDETLSRRFSDDFFSYILLNVLNEVKQEEIVDNKIVFTLPDNIQQVTTNFILEYDAETGYNGTRLDLDSALREFKFQLAFSIRDKEMEKRRLVTLPPKSKEDEKVWYDNLNTYTLQPRPSFDHFAQIDKDEYKQFDHIRYKRGRQETGRNDYVDTVHSEISEYAKSYFLHDSYTNTTDNTFKPKNIIQENLGFN